MSTSLWKVPDEPTKLFSAECTKQNLVQTLIRNEDQTCFHCWPAQGRPRLACSTAPHHFKRVLHKELEKEFLGRTRGGISASAPASCGARFSKRIESFQLRKAASRPDQKIVLGVSTLPGDSKPASAHRDAASATFLGPIYGAPPPINVRHITARPWTAGTAR